MLLPACGDIWNGYESFCLETYGRAPLSGFDGIKIPLSGARRPLHISEILRLVSKRYGVSLDRESIVSALAKPIARKDRFLRTGPNTFSILPDT
jgi:hypothetical protein